MEDLKTLKACGETLTLLTQNDEDVLLSSHHTRSVKHHRNSWNVTIFTRGYCVDVQLCPVNRTDHSWWYWEVSLQAMLTYSNRQLRAHSAWRALFTCRLEINNISKERQR